MEQVPNPDTYKSVDEEQPGHVFHVNNCGQGEMVS